MLSAIMQNSNNRRPASIRTDGTNSFARHTMSVRLPSIIDETIERNSDYSPLVVDSLKRLKEEVIEDRPVVTIAPPAPDWGSWEEQYLGHRGESWLHTEWFFAEHLFYRRIIESVRWWETGRDPFAPMKAEEYSGKAHGELLAASVEISERTPAVNSSADSVEEALSALLLADLWGNRIDLSYKASAALGAVSTTDEELLVDDREKILRALLPAENGPKSVHIVADNAGSELTMDLLLADYLTSLGLTVAFHVKMHPTYVSDSTAPDIHSFLGRLTSGAEGAPAQKIGRRLDSAFQSGMIRVFPDLFWNSGRYLGELPPRLTEPFRRADLVIFKGDVNYRRLGKDALWPNDTPFTEVVGSFPAPIAVLRTMKSDTVFALPAGTAEDLDGREPDWRSNGKRGIIQLFG